MTELPWIIEAKKHVGQQEVRDKVKLMAYFKTAGLNYDPSKVPWCGIGLAAIFHNSIPKQSVPSNPAWALNWRTMGVHCTPQYGSILTFSRDGGGHVAICLGKTKDGDYVCLGCNQGDKICISLKGKGFVEARWPSAFSAPPNHPMPIVSSSAYQQMSSMA